MPTAKPNCLPFGFGDCGRVLFRVAYFQHLARSFTYPIIAVGLWALVASLAGTIYPALVQRFQVEPSESTKSSVHRTSIEMTRLAMGLADVTPPISTMAHPHS